MKRLLTTLTALLAGSVNPCWSVRNANNEELSNSANATYRRLTYGLTECWMNDELPASCRWVHISLVQSQSILITLLNLLNWRMHHCGQVLGGWYREEINVVQYRCMFRAVQTAKRNVWLRIINIKFYCPRWIQVNNFNWIQIFLALRCWVLVPSLRPIVTLHFKGSASTSFCELFLGERWQCKMICNLHALVLKQKEIKTIDRLIGIMGCLQSLSVANWKQQIGSQSREVYSCSLIGFEIRFRVVVVVVISYLLKTASYNNGQRQVLICLTAGFSNFSLFGCTFFRVHLWISIGKMHLLYFIWPWRINLGSWNV